MGEGNRLDCPILARWKSERLSPYLYRGAVDGYVGVTERALSFIDSFDCDVGSPEIRAEVLCHDLIETLRGYGLQDGFDVSLCGRYLTDQLFAIAEEELSRESNKPMDGKRTPYLRNDSGLAFNLFDT